MSDQDPTSDAVRRTLSEISHLFLSDVRDRQTGGAARPVRVPPGGAGQPGPQAALPVTPAAQPAAGPMNGVRRVSTQIPSAEPETPAQAPLPPVTAVLGAHLGCGQFDRVKQYASHLAARIGRVGLIELDADELRLVCFEAAADSGDDGAYGPAAGEADADCHMHDPRALAEAIEEMSWDVRRWLVFVSQPRHAEAQALLASIPHWALLSTCDHDGVVSSYRMLKLLVDAPPIRPRLTLALLDAEGEPEMVRVFRKLAGVSEQFLDWPVEPEPAVRPSPGVAEYMVLRFRSAEAGQGPAGSLAGAPVVGEFLTRAYRGAQSSSPSPAASQSQPALATLSDGSPAAPTNASPGKVDQPMTPPLRISPACQSSSHDAPAPSDTAPVQAPAPTAPSPVAPPERNGRASDPALPLRPTSPLTMVQSTDDPTPGESEVLDLPGPAVSVEAILDAILSRRDGGLVECPVHAPMCTSARVAIARDRRAVLLAVAREGLSDLKSIGQAYRWLVENRALIAMAIPQLAIDAYQAPQLHLLVDHNDVSADLLQPILHAGHVTVQAYRRVRWGGRTGLLLDAA